MIQPPKPAVGQRCALVNFKFWCGPLSFCAALACSSGQISAAVLPRLYSLLLLDFMLLGRRDERCVDDLSTHR